MIPGAVTGRPVGLEGTALEHGRSRPATVSFPRERLDRNSSHQRINPMATKQSESVYRIIDVVGVSEKS